MNIAIIGKGKMGQEIILQAQKRGHEVVCAWGKEDEKSLAILHEKKVDVIIEFTHPEGVLKNLQQFLSTDIPIVCGTTGWQKDHETVAQWTKERNAGLIYGSNFSVGVNLLFKLNKELAKWMNPQSQYDCAIEEQHHRHKADAPSGTALSLAKDILQHLDRKSSIASDELRFRPPAEDELSVGYIRSGEIIGRHKVIYTSDNDTLTIEHNAHNRSGFAVGAVIAAEWIINRKGFINFADIF